MPVASAATLLVEGLATVFGDGWKVEKEGVLADREEVQAVLDTMYLSKNLHAYFEQNMWEEAKRGSGYSLVDKLAGRLPSRLYPGWAKSDFDRRFWNLVDFALNQAEKVRKKKRKALDVFPLSACWVRVQRENYGIELYLGTHGTHVVEGFKSPGEAESWARYNSKEFLREKGLPEGTKLIIIGEDYY